MPRIRSVKPEFYTHPDNVAVSIPARLLYLSLFNQADDEGRLRDQPRIIGALAFGDEDKVNPERLLSELASCPEPRILRYEDSGKRYIQVLNFTKHQKISHPRPSVLPPPCFPESSVNPPASLRPDREVEVEHGMGSGMEGDGRKDIAADAAPDPEPRTKYGGLTDQQAYLLGELHDGDAGWVKVTYGGANKLKAKYGSEVLTFALRRAVEAKLVPVGSAYGLLDAICKSVSEEQGVGG